MGHNLFHLLNLSLFRCHWCKYGFVHIYLQNLRMFLFVSNGQVFCKLHFWCSLDMGLVIIFFLFLFYAVMVYMIE